MQRPADAELLLLIKVHLLASIQLFQGVVSRNLNRQLAIDLQSLEDFWVEIGSFQLSIETAIVPFLSVNGFLEGLRGHTSLSLPHELF